LSLNIADILHGCKLFSDVPAPSFQRLAVLARLCTFDKAEVVFRQGQPCPGVYILGEGMVRVFKVGPGGKEHVLHIVAPGETFAEVAAIAGFDAPASAEAVAESTCVLLPAEGFREALRADHQLCLGMMSGLAIWVRHLVNLMEDVVLRDAAGRLARFLLATKTDADGSLELPVLKRYVASHLNLTSETFSRTLRRLVEAGMVEQPDAARLRIVDSVKLRLVADGLFPKV